MTIKYAVSHVTASISVPAELVRSPLMRSRWPDLVWRKFCDKFYALLNGVDESRNRSRKRRIDHYFEKGLNLGRNFCLRPVITPSQDERLLASRFGWADASLRDLPKTPALSFSELERVDWETKTVFDQPGDGPPFFTDFIVSTKGGEDNAEDCKIRNVLAGLFLRTRTIISAPTFLKRHCFLWLPPGRMRLKTVIGGSESSASYVVLPVIGFTRRPDEVVFRRTLTVTIFFVATDGRFTEKRLISADELSRLIESIPRFPYFNQVRSEIELTGGLAEFAPADQNDAARSKDIALYDWIVRILCKKIVIGLLGNSARSQAAAASNQYVGNILLQSWLISRIWSTVVICDGDNWTIEKMNEWGRAVLNHTSPGEKLTDELIEIIQEIVSYRVTSHHLSNTAFLDYFGLIKRSQHTTYLAFYEPERSTFLDFCPQAGERYPFMSLYLLAWRLPMALGLSSANTLSNLFHHEVNKRKKSKAFYQHIRDLVSEFEDSYDLDILLEAFRAQYAAARRLEGIERDYTQLTAESTIIFQQVVADSSRRSSRNIAWLTWGLFLLTAGLFLLTVASGLDVLIPRFCHLILLYGHFFHYLTSNLSTICHS